MASAVATRVNSILERQRARQTSEPIVGTGDEEAPPPLVAEEQVIHDEHNSEEEASVDSSENSQDEEAPVSGLMRTSLSLEELQEEREIARRRSSACVLLAVFVLFRLWVEAIRTGDLDVMILCAVGTFWAARWVRYNREREEELDRRISSYVENPDGNTEVDRNDIRMLSFQAQLALAILESQRHMMEGGYGGHGEETSPGVSDEAKSSWKHFKFEESYAVEQAVVKPGYGSLLSQKDVDEEPHCSICLGEYEKGEDLVQVPCLHIYHDECLTSWTSNHTKCPLCNYELEPASQIENATGSLPAASV